MNKHKDCKRKFIQLSRTWYADANLKRSDFIDKITVGFYHMDGSTTGEFEISWMMIAGKSVPKIEAFDDGWSALFNFGDMLESMADVDNKNISPEEFCKLLTSLDIEDTTPTERV